MSIRKASRSAQSSVPSKNRARAVRAMSDTTAGAAPATVQPVAAPAHDAAKNGRRLMNWRVGSTSALTELHGIAQARQRARDVYINNPIAKSIIDFLVSNLVGNGISALPTLKNQSLRKKVIQLFESWSLDADLSHGLDFYGLQTLITRAFLVSGECFVLHRVIPTDCGVPYRVQVLEPEQVPFESRDLDNGHKIIQGVEFDAAGLIVAYWVLLHPLSAQTERIEARFISHIYNPTRPSQVRGAPALANVLVRLKQVDDFDDAVIERLRVANLFVGAIKRPEPFDEPPQVGALIETEESGGEELPPIEMSPGAVLELGFGEEINFSNPPDAGTNYTEFMRWQYRTICAALGVPYQVVMGDYADANDRVMRVALNELQRYLTQTTENILVQKMCRPMRRWFFDQAILAGLLPSNKPDMRMTRWIPQRKPYLHPVQDAQGQKILHDAGMLSRSEWALQLSRDAEDLDTEYAADREREQRLSLDFRGKS